MVMLHQLADMGFEVTEAPDGFEAMQFVEKGEKFDVMFVDWMMPGMSGVEFTRRVRANVATSDVPIIIVSSRQSTEQMMEALDAGATEYIIKPFTREAVEAKLALIKLKKESDPA